MKVFESLVHTSFAGAVGWTLLHSLWEGAIVAAALALALSIIRSPRARYLCAGLAMLAILAAALVTLIRMMPEPSRPFATPIAFPAPAPLAAGISGAVPNHLKMPEVVPWLTPLWIFGVIVFYLRGVASWAGARRLKRKGVCLAPEAWQSRLSALSGRLGVTATVSLLESSIAAVPVTIGFIRPVILTPVGMLAGMPASQIECILLHELAHIRRADYLANLLQTAAESLLFYHPAVWWISHVIRVEREKCCDDLVVSTNADAHEYATALSALAENRLTAAALPANGGALMNRIRRLLYPETPAPSLMPLLVAGLVILVTAVGATAWQSVPPAPKAAVPPAPVTRPSPGAPQAAPRQIAQEQAPRPALPPAAAPEVAPKAALKNELETSWKKWLNEDVTYIITDAEREAFRSLQTDAEREQFIEQFWLRRDPTPGTPLNEYQQEHYRRIAYTNNYFADNSGVPGWKTDRGRIYIAFGPPDERDEHPPGAADGTPPFETWRYRYIQGIGPDVVIQFVDSERNGKYHMTADPNVPGSQPLASDLFFRLERFARLQRSPRDAAEAIK